MIACFDILTLFSDLYNSKQSVQPLFRFLHNYHSTFDVGRSVFDVHLFKQSDTKTF